MVLGGLGFGSRVIRVRVIVLGFGSRVIRVRVIVLGLGL